MKKVPGKTNALSCECSKPSVYFILKGILKLEGKHSKMEGEREKSDYLAFAVSKSLMPLWAFSSPFVKLDKIIYTYSPLNL